MALPVPQRAPLEPLAQLVALPELAGLLLPLVQALAELARALTLVLALALVLVLTLVLALARALTLVQAPLELLALSELAEALPSWWRPSRRSPTA